MIIYNLTENCKVDSIQNVDINENILFVISSYSDKIKLEDIFSFSDASSVIANTLNSEHLIHFKTFETFDYVSLLYMDINDLEMVHSKIHLYLGEKTLIIFTDDVDFVADALNDELKLCLDNIFVGREKINHLYYHTFDYLLNDLFLKLESFELKLLNKEEALLTSASQNDLKELLQYKRIANLIKRNTRLLSYICDEIVANDGGSLLESDIVLFNNINGRAKKIYEFALSLLDTCSHLLDIYNSKLSEQSNAFMNAFTIITMYLTPLSFISSFYAMNFVGTPAITWKYGHLVFVAAVLLSVGITTFILKKHKWI